MIQETTSAFKSIKWLIKDFLDKEFIFTQCGINLITMEEFSLSESKMTILIYLVRPGILIGKSGTTIDKLTAMLSEEFNMDVKIELKEFDPFK